MTQSEAASKAPRSGEASDSLHPDDLCRAAALSRESLMALGEADWSEPAHGLEWSCRKTLQHMTSALDWYAMLLATPSEEPFRFRFLPQPEFSAEYPLAFLLGMLEREAAVLAVVAAAADASARGFHTWGQPDPTGYVAMGCAEILLHTDDIVRGHRQPVPSTGRSLPGCHRTALPMGADRCRPVDNAALGGRAREPARPRRHPCPLGVACIASR